MVLKGFNFFHNGPFSYHISSESLSSIKTSGQQARGNRHWFFSSLTSQAFRLLIDNIRSQVYSRKIMTAAKKMRIAVMGAGAVGGYFGARLATAGNEVAFIARGKH